MESVYGVRIMFRVGAGVGQVTGRKKTARVAGGFRYLLGAFIFAASAPLLPPAVRDAKSKSKKTWRRTWRECEGLQQKSGKRYCAAPIEPSL
jgi:hypothetical protein